MVLHRLGMFCLALLGGWQLPVAIAQRAPTADVSAAQQSNEDLDKIIDDLGDEDIHLRRQAAETISRADPPQQRQALPTLIDRLSSETDSQVRLAVLDTITLLGKDAETAVGALLQFLRSDHDGSEKEERHQDFRSAIALAAIGAPAVEGLRTLLAVDEENVRAEVAMALGRIGPEAAEATDELIATLDDESERVRGEAARALGQIGQHAVEPLLVAFENGNTERQTRVMEALRHLDGPGPRAESTIARAARGDDPAVRAAAISALDSCNLPQRQTQSILIEGLGHSSELVRRRAINALVPRRDLVTAMQPQIAAMLTGQDELVARDAAFVLSTLGKNAAPILIEALSDDQSHIAPIGDALGRIGRPAADLVTAAMDNPNSRVRQGAARALGQIVPTSSLAIAKLSRGLDDPNRAVQSACLAAVGVLGGRAGQANEQVRTKLRDDAPQVRLQAMDILFETSPDKQLLLADLLPLLDDPDVSVQQRSIDLIRALGPHGRKALANVIKKLNATDDNVRLAAAELVASHGPASAEAVDGLVQMLDDTSPAIRLAAAKALGQLRTAAAPAFDPLSGKLDDSDSQVRVAVLTALVGTGAEFHLLRPHLARAIDGEDRELRSEALRAVGRIGRVAAEMIPKIILLAKQEDDRRSVGRALRGFQRTGPTRESIPELIKLAAHEETAVRILAIEFLGLAGQQARDAIPLLETMQEDPDENVREKVAAALKAIET